MIRVAKQKKLLCFPFDICERSWAEWTTKWSVIANQGGRLEKKYCKLVTGGLQNIEN